MMNLDNDKVYEKKFCLLVMSIGELHWIMNGAIYYFLKCDNFWN